MTAILQDRADLYDVACDVCGDWLDTGMWRQVDAWAAARGHGWLIMTDRGDVCPVCAERWEETHAAARDAVPPQDSAAGFVIVVLLALAVFALVAALVVGLAR